MTGISLHIGLNQVKSGVYRESFPRLTGAEQDAKSMARLAGDNDFEVLPVIIGTEAKKDVVVKAIRKVVQDLPEGGLFLLTYSGHGASRNNPVADPIDPFLQTWCLYDGELVDKELYRLWGLFKPNTRILVVSDSCHSGSVIKIFGQYASLFFEAKKLRDTWLSGIKKMDNDRISVLAAVDACVILFASCQDSQQSKDSDPSSGSLNSKFTKALLDVWDHGSFQGSHPEFIELIQKQFRKDSTQMPNYFLTGTSNSSFIQSKPFTINP